MSVLLRPASRTPAPDTRGKGKKPKKAKKPKPKPKLIASNRLDFDLDFMWGDEAP